MEGERMRDRYIPASITLLAGAITCVIDIYRKAELLPSLKRLLFVIIIFYIIGLISRAIIRKALEPKPSTPDEEEDSNTEDNAEDNTEENFKENTKNNFKENTKDNSKENTKNNTKDKL